MANLNATLCLVMEERKFPRMGIGQTNFAFTVTDVVPTHYEGLKIPLPIE